MRPFGALTSVEEALARLLAACAPVAGTETAAPAAAAGRVCAAAIVARQAVPAFARAVMDGYACRAADVAGAGPERPTKLRLAGVVHAGGTGRALADRTCVQIATGAPLPPGADAVVPVEDTRREGDAVHVLRAAAPGANWSPAGADFRAGDVAVDAGEVCTPARIGALIAAGASAVTVRRRPRVAILGSGDEVRPAGTALQPGQVHDSNAPMLAALVAAHAGEAEPRTALPDAPEAVAAALAAIPADLLVLTGGTSVGERDVIGQVLAREGTILFHGIAVKPGKPTMAARLGDRLVLGLPGNPTSCLLMAYVCLVPALRRLAGLPAWAPARARARLAAAIRSPADKRHYVPVRLESDVAVSTMKESGTISSCSRADGWIEIPVGTGGLPAGAEVDVVRFG